MAEVLQSLPCAECKQITADYSKGQLKKKEKRRCNPCVEKKVPKSGSAKLVFKPADMEALAREENRFRVISSSRSMLESAFAIAEGGLFEAESIKAGYSPERLDQSFTMDLVHIRGFLRGAQLDPAAQKKALDRLNALCARKDALRATLATNK